MAKASVLWLVGEYCSLVPKIAPDVLRKAAKSFTEEVRPHPVQQDVHETCFLCIEITLFERLR